MLASAQESVGAQDLPSVPRWNGQTAQNMRPLRQGARGQAEEKERDVTLTVSLPGVGDSKVITLESRGRPYFKSDGCRHLSIIVRRELTTVECRDCGEKNLNPVDWIHTMIEEWYRVKDLHLRYEQAQKRFDAKQRCRCEHCNKITRVRPATAAEVRQMEASKP